MSTSFDRKEAAVMGALIFLAIGTATALLYLSPAIAHHIPSILQ